VRRKQGLDLSYLRRHGQDVQEATALRDQLNEAELKRGVTLPENFSLIRPGMSACDYLLSRNVTADDITYYGLGIATVQVNEKSPPTQRIVFPDYDVEGKLCYWVARRYDGLPYAKYVNVPIVDGGATRERQIFNLGRFQYAGYRSAVIVEGPLTGIVAGPDHLAVLGMPSNEQIQIIRGLSLDYIYVALDPDARERSWSLAAALYGSCKGVFIVPVPPGLDAADMGRPAFQQLLRESSIEFTPYDPASRMGFMISGPPKRRRKRPLAIKRRQLGSL
jgi:hypothetical protein